MVAPAQAFTGWVLPTPAGGSGGPWLDDGFGNIREVTLTNAVAIGQAAADAGSKLTVASTTAMGTDQIAMIVKGLGQAQGTFDLAAARSRTGALAAGAGMGTILAFQNGDPGDPSTSALGGFAAFGQHNGGSAVMPGFVAIGELDITLSSVDIDILIKPDVQDTATAPRDVLLRGSGVVAGLNGGRVALAGGAGAAGFDGGKVQIDGGAAGAGGIGGRVVSTVDSLELLEIVDLGGAVRHVLSLVKGSALASADAPTGNRVVYIAIAATAPTSNPVGGFLLYVDPADSALKARGPAGTVTTLAVA